ncbi:PorP/SprF family type IX secretion system membrane protein [Robertkochia aurantiaca]|uniref:PorP/SprF family type IX secretion system membrane protein n=1 Tax=Robertkochia aurantiaca TaxID=2873700 RepID=UPI001CCDAEEA|nr:PorP/SprF family type IX secretion system membrane protein [Robertkochia sp. 3YJGBD-33]
MTRKFSILLMLHVLLAFSVSAQEETPVASIDIPAQNLLKFNRFLINPTFSTVNEDNSYLNFYHRNQWIKFDDNYQTYLASYSGRVGDRTGLGLSIYHQKFATISNFGVMANYAYGVKLAEKSNLTFGFNLSYYDSGVDPDGIDPTQPNDPALADLDGSSLLSFQPGINLSVGSFDVGFYAENLFDYNLKTSSSLTDFGEKTFSGHLMYTNRFENGSGILENGKMSLLSRARTRGGEDVTLSGSLILDLPKVGWVQAGYDDFYGIAAGVGFNLTQRLSLGYTIEKGIKDQVSNFGATHEVSFAYSFTPTLTENRVFDDIENDLQIVEQAVDSTSVETKTEKDAEIEKLRAQVAENDMIIEEMMFRQDSIEQARQKDIDRRFAYLLKFIKDEADRGNQQKVEQAVTQAVQDMKEGKEFNAPEISSEVYADNSSGNREKAPAATAETSKEKTNQYINYDKPVLTTTATDRVAGVDKGYYAIANVFSKERYLNDFLAELESKGIKAGVFKKGNLNYVYLGRYNNFQEAKQAYANNFNGSYEQKAWVLRVKNSDRTNTVLASNTENNKRGEDANSGKNTTQNNIDFDPSYENFIQRRGGVISECTERYVNNLIRPFTAVYSDTRLAEEEPAERGDSKGYYLVANVFDNMNNARRFVDSLKQQGIKANIYINPINNYKYVYLEKFDTWKKAMVSYRSGIKKQYQNDIWIMPVGSS